MPGRLENLAGTFATALADELGRELALAAGRGGRAPDALGVLLRAPGCSIEALRAPLGLSHSAAVRLVDRLVDDGLVLRRPGIDGRTTSLALTGTGRKRAERVRRARATVLERRLRRLRAGERRRLEGLLERVLAPLATERSGDELCRLCDPVACPARRCPIGLTRFTHAPPRHVPSSSRATRG